MLEIKGNTITVTNGDTSYFKVNICTIDDKPYKILPTDIIKFTATKTLTQTPIITEIADEDGNICINPHTTPGTYIYDIQIQKDNEIHTINHGYIKIIGDITV